MAHVPSLLQDCSTVVLDLDGTLVDSNYVHVLAWAEAFRDVGIVLPGHRIHAVLGIGGEDLVSKVAGAGVERAVGDQVRARHQVHLEERLGLVSATEGAAELLAVLRQRGKTVVLASSADAEMSRRMLELVEHASEYIQAVVTGDDVSRTKPHPDVIDRALADVDADDAVLIGDTVWDVRAAGEAGIPCIALLTGGISESALREAGAAEVAESPQALIDQLTG